MIVVSDTSPICYLLLIGEINVLPQLYSQVLIPEIVQLELMDTRSPDIVQTWIQTPPTWLVIQPVNTLYDENLNHISSNSIPLVSLIKKRTKKNEIAAAVV